jgi:hypothetical protein
MNLIVEPFKAEHLARMRVQEAQLMEAASLSPAMLRALEATDAWATLIDGEVLLVGGLAEMWAGRAVLWSYVSANAGPHMVRLTKGVRRLLDASGFARVEVYVDADFEAGHRWAQALGFRLEAKIMTAFFPDGRDAALYGRVR